MAFPSTVGVDGESSMAWAQAVNAWVLIGSQTKLQICCVHSHFHANPQLHCVESCY